MEEVIVEQPAKPKKAERNSAFEILRIIAIIFIIAHHFAVHGGFDFSSLESTGIVLFNKIWINFIMQLGKAGVNLFILISAYFLINSKFSLKKMLSILFELLTFSIIIGVTFYFIDSKEFSLSLLKTIILPFGTETWWFMSAYLLIYLFSPFLNLGIKAMGKKMHLVFIVVLLVIWSFLPTFIKVGYGYSVFGWFILLYLIGSFIGLYDFGARIKPWVGIVISSLSFIAWHFLGWGLLSIFGNDSFVVVRTSEWFVLWTMNNFPQVCCTILLFISFKNIRMKSYRFINIIASTTMAIYLYHDHGDVRNVIWTKVFNNASYASSPLLFIYSLGVILLVFVVGVALGLLYRYSLGIAYNKFLNFLQRKCLYKVDDVFNRVNYKETCKVNNLIPFCFN